MSRIKNNAPAFQFYADDALGGIAVLTCEERGAYWTMLMHSWNTKGLPDDVPRIANTIGKTAGDAETIVREVLRLKFKKEDDGKWRNERQEKERRKQELNRQKNSENATLGWEKKKGGKAEMDKAESENPEVPQPAANTPPRATEPHFPEANLPTWAEIKALADRSAVPEAVAKDFFDYHESKNLWKNRHGVMINLGPSLLVWANRARQMNPKAAPEHSRPSGAPKLADVVALCKQKWPDDERHLNWASSFHSFWNEKKRNWQRNGKLIDWQVELSNQVAKWRGEKN